MATIQDLGKVAYFNKGMYNSETNYEINDVVSYNGSSYVSLLNNNQGNLPTNATYWSVVALKGDKGDTGKPFVIEKTYESIEDMVADYDNMQVNDYVMIQGNIEEEENATLWTKTETEVSPYKWVYLADFSGASGITGATPNIQIGTVTEGNDPSVTRRAGSSNENPILDFVLKTGATGATGATGNGISSVSKTSTSGLTDTYTITYTNGNTTTFNVSNGKGIASIVKTGTSGLIDTYTITYNDGTTSTYTITNGEDGEVTKEKLEEEVDRLSMIYNLFPTTSDEDTEMTLDGTGKVKLKKIGLKGNTSQKTTTGKNLFDVNLVTSVTNGTISDEIITTNETSNSSYSVFPYFSNISLPANTYYLSMDIRIKSGTGYFNKINDATTDWPAVSNPPLSTTFQRYVSSYTYTSDTTLSRILIQFISSTNAVYEIKNIMLSTLSDTTYEEYTGNQPSPSPDYPQEIEVVTGNNSIIIANNDNTQSQTYPINLGSLELCKIDNYQDYLYKENDKWYKYSAIGKIVYNGSESGSWAPSISGGLTRFAGPNISDTLQTASRLQMKSNYFHYLSSGGEVGAGFIYSGQFFAYPNQTITTEQNFRYWLSTHNTTVYYQLSTPTTTEITDATLIEQLDNLENAYSYDTQTNITQTNDDMPFILDVEAILSLKNILN